MADCSILDAARAYSRRGWPVIPIPYRTKKPVIRGWQKLRLTEAELPDYFGGERQNIGVLTGDPAGGLVDADLDAQEARRLARLFMPETGLRHGRPSSPESHAWYVAVTNLQPTAQFRDPTKSADDERSMLVEYRSTGGQTLVPPSVHPSGEPLNWIGRDPAELDGLELLGNMTRLAGCSLLARHYPVEGDRHDYCNAIAGALGRHGWDHDLVPTVVYEIARVASDEEASDRQRAAEATIRTLRAGEPATGVPSLAEHLDERVLSKVCEWLGLSDRVAVVVARGATDYEAPVPPTEAAWPDPLDKAALHGLAGEFVRLTAPHTESDPAALLFQFLEGVGCLAGRYAHCRVEATKHYPSLFVTLVGQTAIARKGTSLDHVRRVLSAVDPEWAQKRVVSGLVSGEGLIDAVRDSKTEHQPIKDHGKVIAYQDVVTDEGEPDKRLLVVEEEFASAIRVLAREGNTLSPIMRNAWDGRECLRTLAKNSRTIATGANISVLGHITQVELRRDLDKTEYANGFANRFLWVCTRRSQMLPDGGRIHEVDFGTFHERLTEALQFAKDRAPLLTRDSAASAIWREVYPVLSRDEGGLFGSVIARGSAQVLRLSLIYAILDCSTVIGEPHLTAALAAWDYAEASARFVFGDAIGDPLADTLDGALLCARNGLTLTDISNLLGRNYPAERVTHALETLEKMGRAARTERRSDGAGRPATVWITLRKKRA